MRETGLALVVLIVIAGCTSSPPPSFHYYLIEPPQREGAMEGNRIPHSLKVEVFSTIGCYGENRIVCRKEPNSVEFYNYHLWAVPPGRMVAESFASWLRESGQFEEVYSPFQQGLHHLILRGQIEVLEEVNEGEAWYGSIVLHLRLIKGRDSLFWKGTIARKIKAEERNPQAVVAALNRGMAEILEEFSQVLDSLNLGREE